MIIQKEKSNREIEKKEHEKQMLQQKLEMQEEKTKRLLAEQALEFAQKQIAFMEKYVNK